MFNANILKNRNTSLFRTKPKKSELRKWPSIVLLRRVPKSTLHLPPQNCPPAAVPHHQHRCPRQVPASPWALPFPPPTISHPRQVLLTLPTSLPGPSLCLMPLPGWWKLLSPPKASHLSPSPLLQTSLRWLEPLQGCLPLSLCTLLISA